MKPKFTLFLMVCLCWTLTTTNTNGQSVTSTKPEMWMNKYNSGFKPVKEGDTLGTIRFRGLMFDNQFRSGATIVGYVSDEVQNNHLPTHMKFRTGAPFLQDRMIILENGNIGIGLIDPDELLTIAGKTKTTNFQMTDSPTVDYVIASDAVGNGTWRDPNDLIDKDADWYEAGTTVEPYDINDNIYTQGRVGIGIDLPTTELDVVGAARISSNASIGGNTTISGTANISGNTTIGGNANITGLLDIGQNGFIGQDLFVADRIGIGVTQAEINSLGAHRLFVDGNIACREVKVAAKADWPDYVFDKNYPFPSLKEVENHIAEFKHLPGIPSASEVEKEGIEVGAMQANLLEKIEELYLHIIELNKKIELLEKQNKQ